MNDKLSQELREALRLLIRKMGVLEKSEASCCNITLGQCHIIIELGRQGELILSDLATVLNLDKSTVSRAVDNLVRNNIVLRKENANDRRYLGLRLSNKGIVLFNEIEENMNRYFNDVLKEIPDNKQIQVVESVHLLLKALNNNNCC